MEQVFYIEINGVIWKLFSDGRLQPLAIGEAVPPGVEVIGMQTPQPLDEPTPKDTDVEAEDSTLAEAGFDSAALGATGSNQSLISSSQSTTEGGSGSYSASIFGSLDRNGDEVLAQAGFETLGLSVPESIEVSDNQELVGKLDPNASITININDDDNLEDNFVNRFENPAVDFFGITSDIDLDSPITLTLTLIDSQGRVHLVEDIPKQLDAWSVNDLDLSVLSEGAFTATVTARDPYGNTVSASAESVKDTLAEGVSVEVDSGSDALVDLFEATAVPLSGEFANVQSGATVSLVVTDVLGVSLTFESPLSADGRWTVNEDLSSLSEGILTIRSETIDLAGNPASVESSIEMALSPRITIENVDDDGFFDDDVYNRFESGAQTFFGTLLNVEDGQVIEVAITDDLGTSVIATAVADNNAWSVSGVDTSILIDGDLSITATVKSLAGDEARADLSRGLNQTADITAEFVDPNLDGVYNALEAMSATLRGVVTDIEEGQPVVITVGDGGASVQAVGQVQSNNLWLASDIDLSIATGATLTLTLAVEDRYGNPATATAVIAYDPLASIADLAVDDQDSDQDQLFNAAEVAAGITLEGATDNIELGQSLTVTISDGVNPDVVVNTAVTNAVGTGVAVGSGDWVTSLNGVDISILNDGDLDVTITGSDVAGNTAIGRDVIHKDTIAAISVQFDGDGQLSATEITSVSISGMASDVEAGQQVNITLSGSGAADINFTAEVQADGSFSSLNQSPSTYDLSGFDDGTLAVTASVVDLAGNPANANNAAIKDTVIELDIDTGINGLDIESIKELAVAQTYTGTTDAEDGQTVTLSFSDGANSSSTTAVVSGGLWTTNSFAPSGLNRSLPWTLTASVSDQAGNSAEDDTPTFDFPSELTLSEAALSLAEDIEVSQLRINIGGDPAINTTPYVFSDASRQTMLDSLTSSDGSNPDISTRVEVSNGGKTIQLIRNIDNFVVIEGQIDDATASVNLTLYGTIEQQASAISIDSEILIQASQNDVAADPSADVVEAPLRFTVRDGLKFAEPDDYQVIEDELNSGNLFDNDNLLEGPLTIKSILYSATLYPVSFSSPAVISMPEGQLTVNADGSWAFAAAEDLNNSASNPIVNFTYIAEDADGDEDFATVSLEVLDGRAGSLADQDFQGTEADVNNLPAGALDTVAAIIIAGSDALDPSTVAFLDGTIVLLQAQNLTSDGETINYVLSGDKQTITATSTSGTVFIANVTAIVRNSGRDLEIEGGTQWYRPLDHPNPDDSLELSFLLTAEDTDGTAIKPALAIVDYRDGNNPTLSVTTPATLDEDGLPGPVISDGTLLVSAGSDFLSTISFNDPADQPGATSNGEALVYTLANGGLTLIGSTSGGEVLRVEFQTGITTADNDNSLTYRVTLSQALDQPNVNGSDNADVSLPFVVTVIDSDGDTTTDRLDITVNDAASAIVSDVTLSVSELPIKLGSGLDDNDSGVISVTAGKDHIVDLGFGITDGAAVEDTSGNPITLNGQSIFWRDNGDGTLEAVLGNGREVFIVTVPDSFNIDPSSADDFVVNFQLDRNIDHAALVSDTAEILVPVLVIDSDGTESTANVTVNIDDGRDPIVYQPENLVLDEANLSSGSVKVEGNIYGPLGSDDLADISLTLDTVGLTTSTGDAISFSQNNANSWLAIANNGSGDRTVFEVTLDDKGNLSLELFEAIIHPDPVTPPLDQNIKTIEFSASISDFDGDSSNIISIDFDVTDAIPMAPIYDAANPLTISEYSTFSGNLFSGDYVTTEGGFGADGGQLSQLTYGGADYDFSVNDPETITLTETLNSHDYGVLTIFSNGDFSIQTDNVFNIVGIDFQDSFTFDMIDSDNDLIEDINFTFDITDSSGAINLTPKKTDEDIAFSITLTGNPGDLDDGEIITGFVFDNTQLRGGTLTLDGVPLPINGDGNPYLDNSAIRLTGSGVPGEVEPDGDLVYTPALNVSDQTANVKFDVTMSVFAISGAYTIEDTFNVKVNSVADDPIWDAGGNYLIEINEDSSDSPLNPGLASLFDTDTSEVLTYRIESIEAGITLSTGGHTISDGQEVSAAEFSAIQISSDKNLSGRFSFTAVAIATELQNSDVAEMPQVFTIDVAGVADTPELTVKDIRATEDVAIDIRDAISGSLTENSDGSESLFYAITVPDGWSVIGTSVIALGPNTYRITDTDVQSGIGQLIPKEDLSQVTEVPTISVQAVAIESIVDGVNPNVPQALSPVKTFDIHIKGVSDEPAITSGPNGYWNYDSGTKVISANSDFLEDQRVALDFGISTEDDDASEAISLHLSGLPAGSKLYDGGGSEIFLPVFDASNPNDPIYTVTVAQMADLHWQPPEDYSGAVSLNLEQINTEPDGDSAAFDLTVEFTLAPVIDTLGGQSITSTGIEDKVRSINLMPNLADLDASEEITEFTVLAGFEGTLFIDGSVVTVPVSGLDLSVYAAGDLPGFLTSGRVAFEAPEDRHGQFQIDFNYQITDTNGGLSPDAVQTLSGTLDIDVVARVEHNEPSIQDDTRIEGPGGTLNSSGGAAIDLTGQVFFYEEDLDGSETLDYVLIEMPAATGWFVDHANAIHDGLGNWLIPAPATSTSVMEQALSIFDGVQIYSQFAYSGSITVQARVLDGSDSNPADDADIITATIDVNFADPGVSTIAFDPDTLEASVADGIEAQNTNLSGHVNTGLRNAGDDAGVDQISFRVTPTDFSNAGIAGAGLSGSGLQVHYGLDGTSVLAWVFSESALANLTLTGVDDDFAGDATFNVEVIATDPSGDTLTETQSLTIDVLPVVDNLLPATPLDGKEDQLFNLNFDLLLGDADTDTDRGVETIDQIVFSNLGTGSFSDPFGHLTDNGDGTYTLSDPSKLSLVFYRPPQHVDGTVSLDAQMTITDTTTSGDDNPQLNSVTDTRSVTLSFDLEPVTDEAILCASNTLGFEDTAINLTGFCADLIDQDGSETISLQIRGVPEGAVLFAGATQLSNNGTDGGSVSGGDLDGVPTYSWTLTQAQLPSLNIVPPEDFSGDMQLTLEAITHENGTSDFVTTSLDFIVGVNPDADGVQITNPATDQATSEGGSVVIDLGAETLENINANEVIQLSVTIKSSSDSTATLGDQRIIADGKTAHFAGIFGGPYTATVLTSVASLSSFELFTGGLAWGDLDLQVQVSSVDSNTVLGGDAEDTSSAESFDLTVSIEPAPDAGVVVKTYDALVSSNGINLPMALTMSSLATNSAPGEVHELEISGLPAGFSFNAGYQEGGRWIIPEADVGNLELITGSQTGNFILTMHTRSTLNGDVDEGGPKSMGIQIVAAGDSTLEGTGEDDYYRGEAGADTFVWSDGDEGSLLAKSDTVFDFDKAEGDIIDISALLSGMGITDGVSADTIIDLSESGGSTLLEIRDASFKQDITLEGVAMTDLVASYTDEQDFLQQLITDGTLITS